MSYTCVFVCGEINHLLLTDSITQGLVLTNRI